MNQQKQNPIRGEKYKIELTAEECVGIQNLLSEARKNAGIISAMNEIEKLQDKFRNPKE